MSSSSRPGTTTRPGSCDVGEQLAAHRQLHVGGRELDGRLGRGGVDQDAREDLHARALRHAACHHLEVLEKVVLGAGDTHSGRSLDGSAAHAASMPEGRTRGCSSLEREKTSRPLVALWRMWDQRRNTCSERIRGVYGAGTPVPGPPARRRADRRARSTGTAKAVVHTRYTRSPAGRPSSSTARRAGRRARVSASSACRQDVEPALGPRGHRCCDVARGQTHGHADTPRARIKGLTPEACANAATWRGRTAVTSRQRAARTTWRSSVTACGARSALRPHDRRRGMTPPWAASVAQAWRLMRRIRSSTWSYSRRS